MTVVRLRQSLILEALRKAASTVILRPIFEEFDPGKTMSASRAGTKFSLTASHSCRAPKAKAGAAAVARGASACAAVGKGSSRSSGGGGSPLARRSSSTRCHTSSSRSSSCTGQRPGQPLVIRGTSEASGRRVKAARAAGRARAAKGAPLAYARNLPPLPCAARGIWPVSDA